MFLYEHRLVKIVRPVAKVVTKGLELPNDHVMDSIEKFVRDLEKLQQFILDESVSSVRLVINPEKMVIAEARRAFTHLNLFGFNTDAIIVNRVLPEEAGTGYFEYETMTEEFVPSKAMHHFQSSQKEALLGVRSILDHVIENFDDTKGKEEDKSSGSHSITISD
ncbi:ArsA family ATPase [Bacillus gobiensis]|uniref:ArsA family ATPase n=1 Tax=Bacillus gobiensis TaxID=1441095 RepID=UPI003D25566D